MADTMAPVPPAVRRPTARVLPVSPDGAVLLLQDQDPAHPGVVRWGSVGGAVEAGESLVEAAVRELDHAMRAATTGLAAAEGAP